MNYETVTSVGKRDLEILGTIKPGDTVSVSSLTVVVHRSLCSGLWRSLSRESRYRTMLWVEHVVQYALSELSKTANKIGYPHGPMNERLWKARDGIESLAETYKDDKTVSSFFSECAEMFTTFILDTHSLEFSRLQSKPINVPTEQSTNQDLLEFVIVDAYDEIMSVQDTRNISTDWMPSLTKMLSY